MVQASCLPSAPDGIAMSQTTATPDTPLPGETSAGTGAATDGHRRWGVPRCGYYSNAMMLWIGLRFLHLAYLFVWFAAVYFFLFVPKARRASMLYLALIRGPEKRGPL